MSVFSIKQIEENHLSTIFEVVDETGHVVFTNFVYQKATNRAKELVNALNNRDINYVELHIYIQKQSILEWQRSMEEHKYYDNRISELTIQEMVEREPNRLKILEEWISNVNK